MLSRCEKTIFGWLIIAHFRVINEIALTHTWICQGNEATLYEKTRNSPMKEQFCERREEKRVSGEGSRSFEEVLGKKCCSNGCLKYSTIINKNMMK